MCSPVVTLSPMVARGEGLSIKRLSIAIFPSGFCWSEQNRRQEPPHVCLQNLVSALVPLV